MYSLNLLFYRLDQSNRAISLTLAYCQFTKMSKISSRNKLIGNNAQRTNFRYPKLTTISKLKTRKIMLQFFSNKHHGLLLLAAQNLCIGRPWFTERKSFFSVIHITNLSYAELETEGERKRVYIYQGRLQTEQDQSAKHQNQHAAMNWRGHCISPCNG